MEKENIQTKTVFMKYIGVQDHQVFLILSGLFTIAYETGDNFAIGITAITWLITGLLLMIFSNSSKK